MEPSAKRYIGLFARVEFKPSKRKSSSPGPRPEDTHAFGDCAKILDEWSEGDRAGIARALVRKYAKAV